MSASGSFGVNYKKNFGTAPTIQNYKLGDIASDPDGYFMYVKAGGTIAQYGWVFIDEDYLALELTTTNAEILVGAAQVSAVINEYIWVFIGGPGGGGSGKGIKGKFAASYAAYAAVNTTASAGVADDSSTTVIKNVVGLTTDSGSGSAIELLTSGFLSVK